MILSIEVLVEEEHFPFLSEFQPSPRGQFDIDAAVWCLSQFVPSITLSMTRLATTYLQDFVYYHPCLPLHLGEACFNTIVQHVNIDCANKCLRRILGR